MSKKSFSGLAIASLAVLVMTPLVTSTGTTPAAAASGHAPWVSFGETDRTKVPDYFGTPNWLNSPQALADAVVTITRGNGDVTGSGATAVATVNPKTGGISGISVTDPGSGYTVAPHVVITSPGVTPKTVAAATADISVGVLDSVTVDEPGYGYSEPVATLSGGNPDTPAVLQASGGVDVLQLADGGSGYTAQPTVEFSLPDVPGGEQPAAVAEMDENGVVTSVEMITSGSGYSHAPTVTVTDGGMTNPTGATVTATLLVTQVDLVADTSEPPVTGGAGYTSAPTMTITDASGEGTGATGTVSIAAKGGVTSVTVTTAGAGYITPGLKKFVDTLPGETAETANNLDEYIPVAVPDTRTYPGTDYYEIAVVQYRHRFSSSLPTAGTLVRGYVQLSTSVVPGKRIRLENANVDPDVAATRITGYTAVDTPSYLGPTIVAQKDRPVRILFRNLLPTGVAGDLFLPPTPRSWVPASVRTR